MIVYSKPDVDIFTGDEEVIVFAINKEGHNDAGFAGRVASMGWSELENMGECKIGEVFEKVIDGKRYCAIVCHSLEKNGWGTSEEQTENIRKCFDNIMLKKGERISTIAIGSGLIGMLSGADYEAIVRGMSLSKHDISLYGRVPEIIVEEQKKIKAKRQEEQSKPSVNKIIEMLSSNNIEQIKTAIIMGLEMTQSFINTDLTRLLTGNDFSSEEWEPIFTVKYDKNGELELSEILTIGREEKHLDIDLSEVNVNELIELAKRAFESHKRAGNLDSHLNPSEKSSGEGLGKFLTLMIESLDSISITDEKPLENEVPKEKIVENQGEELSKNVQKKLLQSYVVELEDLYAYEKSMDKEQFDTSVKIVSEKIKNIVSKLRVSEISVSYSKDNGLEVEGEKISGVGGRFGQEKVVEAFREDEEPER